MRRHLILIISVIFVAVLGLFVYWFLQNFERVPVTVEGSFRGEARQKPYLAAEYLLQRGPVAFNFSDTLPILNLIPARSSLFIFPENAVFNPEQNQQLLDWAAQGGHLIFEAWLEDTEILREQLNLSFVTDHDYGEQVTKLKFADDTLSVRSVEAEYFSTEALPAEQLESFDLRLAHSTVPSAYTLLSRPYFKGRITLLNNSIIFTNKNIGDLSHAQLLWRLAYDLQATEAVYMVYIDGRNAAQSLWQLLWNGAAPLIISLAILLLVWLWMRMHHFGPLIPEPAPERRRLLEHIQASGHFLWRHEQAAVLIKETRQALLQRVFLIHPDWAHLDQEELPLHLASLAKLSPEQIQQALYNSQFNNQAQFTESMSILQQIRTHL